MSLVKRCAVLLICLMTSTSWAQEEAIHSFTILDITPKPEVGNRLLVTLEAQYFLSASRPGPIVLAAWVRRNGTHYEAVQEAVDVIPSGQGKATLKMWFDPSRATEAVTTHEIAFAFRPAYGAPGFRSRIDRSSPDRVFPYVMNWSYGIADAVQARPSPAERVAEIPQVSNARTLPADLMDILKQEEVKAMSHPSCAAQCKDFAISCAQNEPRLSREDSANGVTDGRFVVLSWLRLGAPTLGNVPGAMLMPGQPARWNETTVRYHYRRIGGTWVQVSAWTTSRETACSGR